MSWEGAVVGVKVLEDKDRRWHFLQFAAKLWMNHFPGQLNVQRVTKKKKKNLVLLELPGPAGVKPLNHPCHTE